MTDFRTKEELLELLPPLKYVNIQDLESKRCEHNGMVIVPRFSRMGDDRLVYYVTFPNDHHHAGCNACPGGLCFDSLDEAKEIADALVQCGLNKWEFPGNPRGVEQFWSIIGGKAKDQSEKEDHNKEKIYDEQINPLMARIIEICKEHKIPVHATFEYNTRQYCSTHLPHGTGSRVFPILQWTVMSDGNADTIIRNIFEYSKKHGHSSCYMRMLGLKESPAVDDVPEKA